MPEVAIPIHPARLSAALVLAWLAALPAACLATGAPGAVAAALACVAASFVIIPAVRRDLLGQGPGAVRAIRWASDGRVRLALADGRLLEGRLAAGTLVLGPLVVLVIAGGDRLRRHVVLEGAGGDPAGFAALRRRLAAHGRRPLPVG